MSTPVTADIKRLIVERLDLPTPPDFDVTTPLFDGGLAMDSFAAAELITVLEQHFAVEFDVDDIRPEHFVDVNALAVLIERYLSSR